MWLVRAESIYWMTVFVVNFAQIFWHFMCAEMMSAVGFDSKIFHKWTIALGGLLSFPCLLLALGAFTTSLLPSPCLLHALGSFITEFLWNSRQLWFMEVFPLHLRKLSRLHSIEVFWLIEWPWGKFLFGKFLNRFSHSSVSIHAYAETLQANGSFVCTYSFVLPVERRSTQSNNFQSNLIILNDRSNGIDLT